jgi:hypothetical protein
VNCLCSFFNHKNISFEYQFWLLKKENQKKNCFIPSETFAFDRSIQPKKLPQDMYIIPVRDEKNHKTNIYYYNK